MRMQKNLLSKVEDLNELAKSMSSGVEAHLSLSVDFTTNMKKIPEILKHFNEKFPHTNIGLHVTTMNTSLIELKNEVVDIAIAASFEVDDELEGIPWNSTSIVNIIGASNPLSQNLEHLQIEDLKTIPQIIVSSQKKPTEGKSAGILDGGKHWVVNDFETKKFFIEEGLGWGWCTLLLGKRRIKIRKSFFLETIRPQVSIQTKVFRRRKKTIGIAAQYLWELFTEAIDTEKV